MAVAQKQVMHLANSAKEAAASIVARLPEKEIKLVIRSFECAANRPNRVTRLITRNNIDVFWMNAWFSSLNDDPACPLYPFPVSMPNGFNEAKKIMFDSIMKANKFKNSDFFANITRRRFTSETLKVKDGSNSEILKYLDEVLRKIPVATSIQLSQAINEFSAEKVTVVSLKRSMRKISGIHAHALPSLFHLLDLPFNSVSQSIFC